MAYDITFDIASNMVTYLFEYQIMVVMMIHDITDVTETNTILHCVYVLFRVEWMDGMVLYYILLYAIVAYHVSICM